MELLLLNTKYDLEYYRRKYYKYAELVDELQNKRIEEYEKMIRLANENEILRAKIAKLENKEPYKVKLQISK